MNTLETDIAIIGGGTGGVAAALAALRAGKRVLLCEETDWIGGQFTSQSVPPDENPWIESFGCTAAYRKFRENIRQYYRDHYPLTPEARANRRLNPGGGGVSRLCHEPRVSLAVMQAFLAPYIANGQLALLLETVPVAAQVDGNRVLTVTLQDQRSEVMTLVKAPYFLDATELGDLLPLTGTEYVAGAEAQSETGEPHATPTAQPLNQQSSSWCFAMSHYPGEDHVIEEPAGYAFWRDYQAPFWPGKSLSWTYSHPITLVPWLRTLFPTDDPKKHGQPIWNFRQIVQGSHFEKKGRPADVTLVNWPQIDYWLGALTEVSNEERQRHLDGAKELSFCFFYWMQTEAPRPDGGKGYPGLKLRGDVMGTPDGMAKAVYVRESRRIRAEFTVLEQHVASALRPEGAEKFPDSVGVGCYRIDLHPSSGASGTDKDGFNYIDVGCWPFQIPLGSLIPVRMENLLPACKNLGVTHITNGCYRLHPVEWNIGEAAGALAAHCLETGQTPRQVRNQPEALLAFQKSLESQGFELDWPHLHAV